MKTIRHGLAVATGMWMAALITTSEAATEQQWRFSYDGNGQLLEADGPRIAIADLQRHSYDVAGNRISSTNAAGHTTRFSDHNSRGQPGRIIDANGVITSLTYHPRGWLATSTVHSPSGDSANDASTRYAYDAEGMLTAIYTPGGGQLNYRYDDSRRLVAVRNALGEEMRYTLDRSGNRVAESSHRSDGSIAREVIRQFDELNRLLSITSPEGTLTSHGYDRNGNRVNTSDGNGNAQWRTYDALNRETRLQASSGYDVLQQNDARDNVVAVTDPAGLQTRYEYDGLDNLRMLDSPDAGSSSSDYDPAGNTIHHVSAQGIATTTVYDALNRPTALHFDDSSLDIHYHYDSGTYGLGRLTGVTDASGHTTLEHDHRGNLLRRSWDTGSRVVATSFGYDLADRLTHITYPSGRQVHYLYDAAGQVIRVTTLDANGNSQTIADGITYQPFGPVRGLTLGNGTPMVNAHDRAYRLTALRHGSVLDLEHHYDAAGNMTGINDRLDSRRSQSMGYDALNRLVAANGIYGSLAYSYDATGNRLAISSGAVVDTYNYGGDSHRLLNTGNWAFEYDDSGNLIARFARDNPDGDGTFYHYDGRNRLQRVTRRETVGGQQQESTLASYIYNAEGQRVIKQRGDSRIYYIYDLAGHLLAEVDEDGLSLREYIRLGQQTLAMAYAHVSQPPAMPGAETIIDDADPDTTLNGNWERVRKKGAWGDYYYRSRNNGASFRWHLSELHRARYAVYAWWPKSRKNNPDAQFLIRHGNTGSMAIANQARGGKQWVLLGTYDFEGSGNEYIELSDLGGLTAADGIRLVERVEPPPVVTISMYYFHNNHLGTPQVVTDQAGNVVWQANYRPFGQADLVSAGIEQNLRFPGQYFDSETGLHYNYYRDYDPVLGRFLQSDPIGLHGGISTYGYAQDNPYIFSDPTGLLTVAEANTIGGTIGGAIGGGINGALSGAGIGATAGTAIPGIGNLAGGFIGAALGSARGAAGGAVAGAASAELGVGGASLVAAVTNGPIAGAASLTSEVVRSLLPAPASQLGGGFLGGAIGGISGGPLAVIGGAYGGVIGGAVSAAICLGDRECRKELLGEESLCE